MSEMEVKNKELVFLIGFQKSGNTWLASMFELL